MTVGGEKHRVLIIDDERLIADTLAAIFSGSGYEARAVYSAEEALETIANWYPDLAIIDVCLPKMNGIDLAMLLKAKYPECQISLISGQPSTTELLAAAPFPFEVLAKPMHPTELLKMALRLLRPAAEDEPGRLMN